MNAVMTEPEVPAIHYKCTIEEVFGGAFIELIQLAPKNPVVRGLILAQTRKMPGPECETFEQVKEWVETTCDKKLRASNSTQSSCRDGILIKVEFSETENGRANYSVPQSGSDEFAVDEDELVAMVRDAIDDGIGLDGVVETISSLIDDEAWNRCSPNLDDCGDYDYSDHDSGDGSDPGIEFSKTEIRDRLRAFLTQRHPQLLEELAGC